MELNDLQNGKIFLIDKPLHWTSFQVVNKIKWAILKKFNLKKIKVGHAGTLDPLASGLLLVCVGKATKEITRLQAAPKVYTGVIQLGATTPSYDLETEINATYPTDHITAALIESTATQFVGQIEQTPPLFSALKKDGKRLYELAREGKTTEIPPRVITISKLILHTETLPSLGFEVHCSKGTYIRSLAHDMGKALGSGGYLSQLRRTQIGSYRVEDAISIENFSMEFESEKSKE